MRYSTVELDKRLAQLEGQINAKKYRYCFDTTELLGNMRMDLETGEIELYEDTLPRKGLFFILYPELIVDAIADGESLENIDPFDVYYLKYIFGTNNNKNLSIRCRKLMKQWDKEEQERLDKSNITSNDCITDIESFPEADQPQHKPPQVKAYDKAKAETEAEHLRKVMQTRRDIEEEFGNNHIETLF